MVICGKWKEVELFWVRWIQKIRKTRTRCGKIISFTGEIAERVRTAAPTADNTINIRPTASIRIPSINVGQIRAQFVLYICHLFYGEISELHYSSAFHRSAFGVTACASWDECVLSFYAFLKGFYCTATAASSKYSLFRTHEWILAYSALCVAFRDIVIGALQKFQKFPMKKTVFRHFDGNYH